MEVKYNDVTMFKVLNLKRCKVCGIAEGGIFSPRHSYYTYFLCAEGHRREGKFKKSEFKKFEGCNLCLAENCEAERAD